MKEVKRMKTLLVGINSKYIHPNIAIRLLKGVALQAIPDVDIAIKEWTIKDSASTIVEEILNFNVDLIGFSCYIWNIELIKEILLALKMNRFLGKILLGGPEVSYEYQDFFSLYGVDYIIRNEGELAFTGLLKALIQEHEPLGVPNLVTSQFENQLELITSLDELPFPYDGLDYKHQIMYLEASRGCPYHCSYCMASLEKKVRTFSLDRIKDTILRLLRAGAKTFKFLDRTFNIDPKRAMELFRFINEQAPDHASFQFEISGDLFTSKMIDYLIHDVRPGLFRFEIGIQSTNPTTNRAIGRHQNTTLLFQNIQKLQQGGKIGIHLDLIAGLPFEDLSSFKNTLNEAIQLRPLELQLGFLKFLKGTRIMQEASLYDYQWHKSAPYEIITNHILNEHDIAIIHTAENALDKFYNTPFFKYTIHYILDLVPNAFDFFFELGQYYEARYSWIGYNLDELFIRFDEFIMTQISIPHPTFLYLMKKDYLLHFSVKPKIWWPRPGHERYHQKVRKILSTQTLPVLLDDVFRYGVLETEGDHGFMVLYMPDGQRFLEW